MATILFVDDDIEQRHQMSVMAAALGHHVLEAASISCASDLLISRADASKGIDLLIIDAAIAQTGAALSALCDKAASAIVSVSPDRLSGIAGLMQAGAVDFLPKPVQAERLQVSIANALHIQALMRDARRANTLALRLPERSAELIAKDPAMVRALSVARRAARAEVPVLIEGEAGTGREALARLIHMNSTGNDERRARPFVVLRCQLATPAGLDLGEFAARVREAQGGTLYLDDIDALPPLLQERLMGLVSENDDRDRSRRGVRAEMRVIAATRTSLLDQVRMGTFREDLFYRFNVLPITLPPLRARRSDITALLQMFITRFAASEGKIIEGMTQEALALLMSYPWPGNVAELENAAFRAVALAENTRLGVEEFPQIVTRMARAAEYGANCARPAPLFPHGSGIALPANAGLKAVVSQNGQTRAFEPASGAMSSQKVDPFALALVDNSGEVRPLEDLETDIIQFAIRHYQGRMSEVSRRLGIGRSTLYRKIKDFCFDDVEQDVENASYERSDVKTTASLEKQKRPLAVI
ncbi:sigma-54-dependent transcriptional regulator [Pseudochelatococcus sp. G4_1912]|uniref:sigma-54-dependent transcriptional regulator n=1 Tax=Pseudochelatococcus sp. G4_1912 TaxID=3114288 RepID=UPI0039C6FFDF